MHRPFRFCPRCGGRLSAGRIDGHRRPVCRACGFIHYLNPTPAVGVLLARGGRLLLVRRRYPPYAGLWSMPAGFMEYGEAPEECAFRETLEETGLRVRIGRLVGVYSGRDDPRTHAILIVYRASAFTGKPRAGDDASEVGWFPIDGLPRLAFRAHRQAIRDLAGAR
jgi:ADP-ribose pyrophosphatase YjhB (NUDIX family)